MLAVLLAGIADWVDGWQPYSCEDSLVEVLQQARAQSVQVGGSVLVLHVWQYWDGQPEVWAIVVPVLILWQLLLHWHPCASMQHHTSCTQAKKPMSWLSKSMLLCRDCRARAGARAGA